MTIDETGRLAGRGAYLCRDAGCWTRAVERGALGRALEAPVPAELREALAAGTVDTERRRRSPWPGVGAAPAADADRASRRVATATAASRRSRSLDPRERGAIELPTTITVKELAELLAVNPADVIRELIKSGIFATINQLIDRDTASLVAGELGYEVAETDRPDRRRRRRRRGGRGARRRPPRRSSSTRTTRRTSCRAPRS